MPLQPQCQPAPPSTSDVVTDAEVELVFNDRRDQLLECLAVKGCHLPSVQLNS
jgi:hypothetical protein